MVGSRSLWLGAILVILASCGPTAPATGARPASVSPGARGTEAAAPVPRTTLKVAYVPVLAFAPLYRALSKGYFSDAGIDVDLTIVQSASDSVAFLGSGQMDVAVGNVGAPLFNAINRGLEVRVVAGNSYNQPEATTLVAAPLLMRRQLQEELRSPADLRGRKVAINAPGGIQEYSLSRLLENNQIPIRDVDVQYIPFPEMMTALANGAIDAAMLPEPFSGTARDQGIAAVLVANPSPGSTITAVMFGENMLKPDRDRPARAFLEAMRKAANELQSEQEIFSDENLTIWKEYTGVAEQDIKRGAPYAYSRNLVLDTRSVLDQQAFFLRAGRLDFAEPLPESKIVEMRFTPRG